MQANVGTTDRIIRLLIAAALLTSARIVPAGTTAILLYVLAGIAALTALWGFCPLYRVFGRTTNRKKQ